MCFEQKSTREPKFLCSTMTKIQATRGKSCDLSQEKVAEQLAVRKPFSSQSNRLFERLQLHKTSTAFTSSENIVIPSNGSSYPSNKTIVIRSKGSPPELSVPKQPPTFRTARRNPLKKHKTLFVQKKNH